MDDDEDEPVDGPEPEALALPDALPIALVDESLPVSKFLNTEIQLLCVPCLTYTFCAAWQCIDLL